MQIDGGSGGGGIGEGVARVGVCAGIGQSFGGFTNAVRQGVEGPSINRVFLVPCARAERNIA